MTMIFAKLYPLCCKFFLLCFIKTLRSWSLINEILIFLFKKRKKKRLIYGWNINAIGSCKVHEKSTNWIPKKCNSIYTQMRTRTWAVVLVRALKSTHGPLTFWAVLGMSLTNSVSNFLNPQHHHVTKRKKCGKKEEPPSPVQHMGRGVGK